MKYTDYIEGKTPVVVRSYTSGVVVGRLVAGEAGTVVLSHWRWLRRWENVGNEGSVYDLVHSDQKPVRTGPFAEGTTILQQADVMEIDETTYTRLASPGE